MTTEPMTSAACCCPDPLREVHPGCPLHGHSPEAYVEPTRHDPQVTVDAEGFRIVCPCGWMSGSASTIGSGPIRCMIEVLTNA